MSLSDQALLNLKNNGSTHVRQAAQPLTEDDKPLIPYNEYINSGEWAELRILSAHVWGSTCLVCQSKNEIERHHLFYRHRIEKASPYEILPICRACHEAAHTEGDNKNAQPLSREGLDSIVARLFHRIVRTRGLPASTIDLAHKAFWKHFYKHAKSLFRKSEGPQIVNVKTVYKTRKGFKPWKKNKRKGKNGKKRKLTLDESILRGNYCQNRAARANYRG